MTFGTYAVLILTCIATGFALRGVYRSFFVKKDGGCGGGCKSCAHGSTCNQDMSKLLKDMEDNASKLSK